MFGSEKRKEGEAKERQAQWDTDRQTAVQTGETGSADQVAAALAAASDKSIQEALKEGAMTAFMQGRPENFQSYIVWAYENEDKKELTSNLLELTTAAGTADPVSVILLACDSLSEEKKQKFLNDRLYWSVKEGIGGEDFVKTLLEAGADASHKSSQGTPSVVMDWALHLAKPFSLVKLLSEYGGNIDDVIFQWTVHGRSAKEIEKAKFYKEQLNASGQNETAAKSVNLMKEEELSPKAIALLLEMQEQIRDLTEKVDTLTGKVDNLSSQEAGTKAKTKRAYPSLYATKPSREDGEKKKGRTP